MTTTREDLSVWFDIGVGVDATHMIVAVDEFDWSDYPVYIAEDEDVASRVNELNAKPLSKVIEVYWLRGNKAEQIAAQRTFNYGPPVPTTAELPEVRRGSSAHAAPCPRANPDPLLSDDFLCMCGPKRDPEPEPLMELFRAESEGGAPWLSPWEATYEAAWTFGEANVRSGEWSSFGISKRFFAPKTPPEVAGV